MTDVPEAPLKLMALRSTYSQQHMEIKSLMSQWHSICTVTGRLQYHLQKADPARQTSRACTQAPKALFSLQHRLWCAS